MLLQAAGTHVSSGSQFNAMKNAGIVDSTQQNDAVGGTGRTVRTEADVGHATIGGTNENDENVLQQKSEQTGAEILPSQRKEGKTKEVARSLYERSVSVVKTVAQVLVAIPLGAVMSLGFMPMSSGVIARKMAVACFEFVMSREPFAKQKSTAVLWGALGGLAGVFVGMGFGFAKAFEFSYKLLANKNENHQPNEGSLRLAQDLSDHVGFTWSQSKQVDTFVEDKFLPAHGNSNTKKENYEVESKHPRKHQVSVAEEQNGQGMIKDHVVEYDEIKNSVELSTAQQLNEFGEVSADAVKSIEGFSASAASSRADSSEGVTSSKNNLFDSSRVEQDKAQSKKISDKEKVAFLALAESTDNLFGSKRVLDAGVHHGSTDNLDYNVSLIRKKSGVGSTASLVTECDVAKKHSNTETHSSTERRLPSTDTRQLSDRQAAASVELLDDTEKSASDREKKLLNTVSANGEEINENLDTQIIAISNQLASLKQKQENNEKEKDDLSLGVCFQPEYMSSEEASNDQTSVGSCSTLNSIEEVSSDKEKNDAIVVRTVPSSQSGDT